ncbi:MAG: FHA domain-containing protein [Anaerolineae bacterium]|nr:FHA domain-containing protein [Anaerolineae bacterium]
MTEPEGRKPSEKIVVNFIDLSEECGLSGKEKYVFGRSVPSRGTHRLDLDLNHYGGYEAGVSRQHALIKVDGYHIKVVDLNSSNRTFIDEEELYPGNEYELSANSVLRLGKLRMKIRLAD